MSPLPNFAIHLSPSFDDLAALLDEEEELAIALSEMEIPNTPSLPPLSSPARTPSPLDLGEAPYGNTVNARTEE